MKRIIILFLLLLAAPVFGTDFVWDGGGGDNNWSTPNNWDQDLSYPGELTADGTDTAEFNNIVSTACTLDVSPAYALSDFTMQTGNPGTKYSGTLTMGSETLDIDGDCELSGTLAATAATIECSGNFEEKAGLDAALPSTLTIELNGTGTSDTVSAGGGALVINTAGTITLSGTNIWDSLTGTDGAVDMDSNDFDIDGDIKATSTIESFTNQGKFIISGTSGTGSYWTADAATEMISQLEVTGTLTITANNVIVCKKLSGTGTINGADANSHLTFDSPSASFWDFESPATCNVKIWLTSTPAVPGGPITINSGNLQIRSATGTWTASGHITLTSGDLYCRGWTDTTFDMATYNLSCTNVTVGDTAGDLTVDFGSGTHTVSGNIIDGASASGTNTIEFSTSDITLTGTLDGDSITCQSDASGSHAIIHGGTVTNVDFSSVAEALDATNNCTNGGNNSNVWFPSVMGVHSVIGAGMIGSGEAQ